MIQISLFSGVPQWLADQLNLVTKDELMSEVDDAVATIKSEFDSYKADVVSKVSSLGSTIASLQAQIATMPPTVDMTKVNELLDDVKAAHSDLLNSAQS